VICAAIYIRKLILQCVASFAPVTSEERMVYTTASAVLTTPYTKPTEASEALPMPNKRLFLEMAVSLLPFLLEEMFMLVS
jgi:hypothetical protein